MIGAYSENVYKQKAVMANKMFLMKISSSSSKSEQVLYDVFEKPFSNCLIYAKEKLNTYYSESTDVLL